MLFIFLTKTKGLTMTRRYFKDPVIALYMMREFGVKLSDCDQEDLIYILTHNHPVTDFEVRDESEHIFKAIKGDQIFFNDSNNVMLNEEANDHVYKIGKIIMRDNKQFFNGEVEND